MHLLPSVFLNKFGGEINTLLIMLQTKILRNLFFCIGILKLFCEAMLFLNNFAKRKFIK